MRGKRSKQYKKLMQQYGLAFGFREPYQVLLDADILKDADRFKMDLIGGLERTLHGEVKPMITQCSMRHLYKAASEPGVSYLIDKAKLYERRRCGHRPDEFPEPLSAKECIESVVDPKGAKHNKHRYVVASQDIEVRKAMRKVEGVPLVYINRSVMIMEPMAGATEQVRDRDEKLKFRDGLKRGSGSSGMKRKREDEGDELKKADGATGSEAATKKRKAFGAPKGPNPLSVKKAKKVVDGDKAAKKLVKEENSGKAQAAPGEDGAAETEGKRKRRRKHKSGAGGGDGDGDGHVTSEGAVAETVDVVASDEA